MIQLNRSMLAWRHALNLAADIAHSEYSHSAHLGEALQYRPKLMM